MKKSLLLTFLIWLSSLATYYYILHGHYEPPADWISAIVGSFTTLFGVGCLRNLRIAYIDRKMISNSARGGIPNTKKLIAVSGPILAIESPVKTPFSNQDAVLYSYDICKEYEDSNSDSNTKRTELIFSGEVLVPSQVMCPWGKVRILSYPSLEGLTKKYIDNGLAVENARDFISKTQFEDMTSTSISGTISHVKDIFTDTDGNICKHLQMNNTYDLNSLYYKESSILQGEEVCIVGCYDPEKQGIISDFNIGQGIIRLYKGNQSQAIRKVSSRISGLIFGAVFFLIIVNAIMYYILWRYQNTGTYLVDRTSRFVDAIKVDNRNEVLRLIKFGINPNFANSAGETPLMFALNAETVEILVSEGAYIDSQNSYGRTPLMVASMYGREEVVKALLKLEANPNLKDNYNRTALSFAKESNYTSIERLLLDRGAEED